MSESFLRRFIVILVLLSLITFLWAIGSNSRKKVEIKTSDNLRGKVDELTKANTVTTNDLKIVNNKLGELQLAKKEADKSLAQEKARNEALQKNLKSFQTGENGLPDEIAKLKKEAEDLRKANMIMGEELVKLKERDFALQEEISQLRSRSNTATKKSAPETKQKNKEEKSKSDSSSPKNFAW